MYKKIVQNDQGQNHPYKIIRTNPSVNEENIQSDLKSSEEQKEQPQPSSSKTKEQWRKKQKSPNRSEQWVKNRNSEDKQEIWGGKQFENYVARMLMR